MVLLVQKYLQEGLQAAGEGSTHHLEFGQGQTPEEKRSPDFQRDRGETPEQGHVHQHLR